RLSTRPRKRRWLPTHFPAIESLEDRSLLSGDTIAAASFVDLQDGQSDRIVAEIGDEAHGNLDVDLYQVTLTAGQQLVVTGTSITPRDQIEQVASQIQSAIAASSGSTPELSDAAVQIGYALVELNADPDIDKALGALKKAAKDLDRAKDEGELNAGAADDLLKILAGAARNMARNLIEHATDVNAGHGDIEKAEAAFEKGDAKRVDGKHSAAIDKYKSAASKANNAAKDAGLEDQSQALKSVIVVIRVFDPSGNQLAQESGTGTVTLTYTVANAGTFFVGISGNDNFEYDPNYEESGQEGSTGFYEMEMVANDPPILTSFAVVDASHLGAGWFELKGTVEDELPEGCTVMFGGILMGHSVGVEEDGTFSYFIFFETSDPNCEGLVTAQVADDWMLFSNTEQDSIDHPC
ncbi:MAG: hypothetical protein O3A00_21105, partial [Planctomycetota bacterium]|nr:hypothetical protein [Planctomycetota bacterium]